MLDTNLKSNRKIRTIITIVILSLFAAGVVESYYVVRKNIASTFTVEDDVEECIERMDYSLATGNRLLYSEVTDAMDASEQMELMWIIRSWTKKGIPCLKEMTTRQTRH